MQKNHDDPAYDHSSGKWLSEEEENELAQLLQEGFGNWTLKEYRDFLQGCGDFGPANHKEIAAAIGTKTEEEVHEYAAVFWAHGE